MSVRGVPPGRAGRLWLERRTRAAARAADVLDRKLRILRAEQERLEVQAGQAEARWREEQAQAETWLLRAVLLGHRRGLLTATDRPEADVVLAWATAAGVSYPVLARFAVAARSPAVAPFASAAHRPAAEACVHALEAAVRFAVANAAVRTLRAEVAATRARLRAIEDRWLPRLAEHTRLIAAQLEEQERAEGTQLRWAARRAETDENMSRDGPR